MLLAGVLLQDTFSVSGNAFCLKPVFKSEGCEIQAKNNSLTSSKDWFESHMSIHFDKKWFAGDYRQNADVNRIGNILGIAYGNDYWTKAIS